MTSRLISERNQTAFLYMAMKKIPVNDTYNGESVEQRAMPAQEEPPETPVLGPVGVFSRKYPPPGVTKQRKMLYNGDADN